MKAYLCPMKNLNLIAALLLTISLLSCSRKAEEAAEYNDAIIEHQKKIIASFDRFDSSFVDTLRSREMVEFAYVNMQSTIKQSILAMDSIGPFENDPSMQNAARDLFKTYDAIVETEYEKLRDIRLLPADQVTPAIIDTSLAVQIRIHDASKLSQSEFLRAQEDFGKKYNLIFE